MTPELFISIYTIINLTALATGIYMEHLCLKMIKDNKMENFVFVDPKVEKTYQRYKKVINTCVYVFAFMFLMAVFYLLGIWAIIAVALFVGWTAFMLIKHR